MKKIICLLLLLSVVCVSSARSRKATCNLVFIGNSITEGVLHADKSKTAPPVLTASMVGKMLSRDIIFRNCGRSGATTVDFLPSEQRDFVRVEKAIKDIQEISYEPIIFSIMLGTNDSAIDGTTTGSPVSRADYKQNLKKIIEACREVCPNAIFVLHRPIWYSPNSHNGAQYLVAGQKRMVGHTYVLIDMARKNPDIYFGANEAFDYFRAKHHKFMFAEDGKAGIFYLHPNEAGAKKLARFWAEAIVRTVKAAQ